MEGVMVVIRKDNKYLLGTESKMSPITGKWRLLGGKVEIGETPIDTLNRELMEEAGISVEVLKKLGDKQGDHRPITIHIYLAEFLSGNLVPNPREIGELKYFHYADIFKLDLDPVSEMVFMEYRNSIENS
jgi:8-oxo-dGTP pyrophosphatase MutT (NUDIX family)